MPSETKILDNKQITASSNQDYVIDQSKSVCNLNSYVYGGGRFDEDDCSQSSDYAINLFKNLENYFSIRGFDDGAFDLGGTYLGIEIEGEGVSNLIEGTSVYSNRLNEVTEISSSKIRIKILKTDESSKEISEQNARELVLTREDFVSRYLGIFASHRSVANFLFSTSSFSAKTSNPCYSECGKVKISAPANLVANTLVTYDVTLKGDLPDLKVKKTDKNSLSYFHALPSETQKYVLEKHFEKDGQRILHNVKIEAESTDIKTYTFSVDSTFDGVSYCRCVNSFGPGDLLINSLYNVSGTKTTINLTGHTTGIVAINASTFRTECSRNFKEIEINL